MSKVNLKKLLNASEIPSVLTFLDRFELCGRNLLWTTIKSHLKEGRNIHYLCYSINPSTCYQALSSGYENNFKTYDLYSDPLQWNSNSNNGICAKMSFTDIINFSNYDSEKKVVVVIDNINAATNYTSELNIFRNIQSLLKEKCVLQVLVYCHEDGSSQSFITSLENLFPSSLRINPTIPPTCKILLKKKSGKIFKSVEEYSIDEKYDINYCRLPTSKPVGISVEDTESLDVKFDTSFNLSLTDSQKEAKSKVILPHTRILSTGGQIHYYPDADDDFDDEEPDDDLEI